MYAVTLSTPARHQRSPIATRIASVAIRWLRRFSLTHQPASTALGAIPSMPSPAKRSSATPRKLLSPRSRIAQGPNPCSRHCSSAARVSRNASSEFPDARACSASSSGERGFRISRAVRRTIARSAESPTERPCTPLIIARTLRGHSRTLAQPTLLPPHGCPTLLRMGLADRFRRWWKPAKWRDGHPEDSDGEGYALSEEQQVEEKYGQFHEEQDPPIDPFHH